jgi:hypothetical protein
MTKPFWAKEIPTPVPPSPARADNAGDVAATVLVCVGSDGVAIAG